MLAEVLLQAPIMAMASATRSTRRSDGHPRSHHPRHLVATHSHTRSHQPQLQQHPNSRTAKRPFEPSAHDFDPVKPKKARFTVEIISKAPFRQKSPSDHVAPRPPRQLNPPAAPRDHHHRQQPPHTPYSAAPAAPVPPRHAPAAAAAADDPGPGPALTKSQEKARNGIRHELDRLHPDPSDTRPEGRKLRSQEATRFKSELSAYFPDYDEVIGNDPKEQHILNLDTPMLVVDSAPSIPAAVPLGGSWPDPSSGPRPGGDAHPVRSYPDALFTDLYDAQKIDFSFLETRYKGKTPDDPLPDSYFEPAHKKAERLERSIRNSEKGRAQHEKDQIIRLLEGLQGPDWLRTMGVSGVTESRKKQFEPARAHFIKGCQAILEKFRLWSLEEKRRKLEKERALAEQARASEKESEAGAEEKEEEVVEEEEEIEVDVRQGDDAVELAEEEEEQAEEEQEEEEEEEDDEVEAADSQAGDGDDSDGDPPDLSDVDASIAKQLREEAMASVRLAAKAAAKRPPPPPSPEPHAEFTSFFAKRYQRDAALSKNRRRGRTVLAWGHPVPEPAEADFDLPGEYLGEDVLRANARKRRLSKRGHGR